LPAPPLQFFSGKPGAKACTQCPAGQSTAGKTGQVSKGTASGWTATVHTHLECQKLPGDLSCPARAHSTLPGMQTKCQTARRLTYFF
jgi:hypothetical protein